ncbi:iron-sulfur cluster-binding protein [Spiroplasma melliferum]|uniref:Dihydroorotate dehydrogenase n=2 Tax=Spiroplasma melliferum TaxID=2134 RepID=A0AAI9T3V1_SPIME|nr:dihydroorotate dehydrogenase [Spiroplasma melliferum]KAI93012.1 dihydroorotate dehydrogenase [Spiroplasma melliferum KC3]QCO24075.1 dihydroorotate dehydrogenase electron transfer subunit [Spiroplasma melliferum]
MTKQIIESTILLSNQQLGPDLWLATFKAPHLSKIARSGQFVLVEPQQQFFLKRPFSFFDINPVAETISIYYQCKGLGTWYMANQWKVGQVVQIQGPHGQGFQITPTIDDILIVAGGIGIAPMKALIDDLIKKEKKYHVIFGGRTKDALNVVTLFQDNNNFFLNTDDGSIGQQQNIVTALENYLTKSKPKLIIACGPDIVLTKINELAKAQQIATQISYESHMACGVGACMGCTKTIDGVNKKICTDGPIIVVEY